MILSKIKNLFKDVDIWILFIALLPLNNIPLIQFILKIGKSFFSIASKLSYHKLEAILKGENFSDEDRAKLRAKLVQDVENEETALFIINCINNSKDSGKTKYFFNLTQCLLNDEIDRKLYFKISDAINVISEDDLKFLADNVKLIEIPEENHFKSNYSTQKLFTIGAMRTINTAWKHGEYAFTPFGKLLDICAVSFDDNAKYPNRKKEIEKTLSELNLQI